MSDICLQCQEIFSCANMLPLAFSSQEYHKVLLSASSCLCSNTVLSPQCTSAKCPESFKNQKQLETFYNHVKSIDSTFSIPDYCSQQPEVDTIGSDVPQVSFIEHEEISLGLIVLLAGVGLLAILLVASFFIAALRRRRRIALETQAELESAAESNLSELGDSRKSLQRKPKI